MSSDRAATSDQVDGSSKTKRVITWNSDTQQHRASSDTAAHMVQRMTKRSKAPKNAITPSARCREEPRSRSRRRPRLALGRSNGGPGQPSGLVVPDCVDLGLAELFGVFGEGGLEGLLEG